jgi:hypothetical protein
MSCYAKESSLYSFYYVPDKYRLKGILLISVEKKESNVILFHSQRYEPENENFYCKCGNFCFHLECNLELVGIGGGLAIKRVGRWLALREGSLDIIVLDSFCRIFYANGSKGFFTDRVKFRSAQSQDLICECVIEWLLLINFPKVWE